MMHLTSSLFEVCLSKDNKAKFDSRVWPIVDLNSWSMFSIAAIQKKTSQQNMTLQEL